MRHTVTAQSRDATARAQGIVGQNGDILRKGDVFGLDMVLSSDGLRDRRALMCISYVEVAALTRSDLEEVRCDLS